MNASQGHPLQPVPPNAGHLFMDHSLHTPYPSAATNADAPTAIAYGVALHARRQPTRLGIGYCAAPPLRTNSAPMPVLPMRRSCWPRAPWLPTVWIWLPPQLQWRRAAKSMLAKRRPSGRSRGQHGLPVWADCVHQLYHGSATI